VHNSSQRVSGSLDGGEGRADACASSDIGADYGHSRPDGPQAAQCLFRLARRRARTGDEHHRTRAVVDEPARGLEPETTGPAGDEVGRVGKNREARTRLFLHQRVLVIERHGDLSDVSRLRHPTKRSSDLRDRNRRHRNHLELAARELRQHGFDLGAQ